MLLVNKDFFSARSLAAPLAGLLAATAVIFVLNVQYFIAQIKIMTITPQSPPVSQVVATNNEKVVRVAPDPKVIIPSIGIDAPVVYGMTSTAEPDIQRALQDGVLHFADSPKPGEAGNGVYVGHSSNVPWVPGDYKFVFAPLEKLQINDTFYLNYESRQYTYRIISKKVVLPNDVSVLESSDKPTATLITCTPVGTNLKRLVIRAEQIDPAPTSTADNRNSTSIQVLPGKN